MTDVKSTIAKIKISTEKPSHINWKQKLAKMVPYTDNNGNEVQQDPPINSTGILMNSRNSFSKQILEYVEDNKRR